MKIIESMLTNNPCYKTNKKITVKGLMLHSVGCAQPNASVFVKNWNKASYDKACVHGFIDANTGDVYQTLPWNHRAWHCGSGSKGSANDTHIGVEMCEPAQIKYVGGATFTCTADKLDAAKAAVKTAYESAVALFAQLCKEFNLDPLKDGVVISHSEGYARGIASNHGDPVHLWTQLNMGYTMDGFRSDVAKAMGASETPTQTIEPNTSKTEIYRVRKSWTDSKSQLGAFGVFENARALADKNPGYCVYGANGRKLYPTETDESIRVEVKVTDLRIRCGPGTNYAATGNFTGKGIFTIVEIQNGSGSVNGWGKLKSGAGWISLDYVTKL